MIRIHLNEEERATLRARARQEVGRVAERIHGGVVQYRAGAAARLRSRPDRFPKPDRTSPFAGRVDSIGYKRTSG